MKDRIAGAPGRYSVVIAEGEYQKIQPGQSFAVTLTRADKPEVEGTPYCKASVLPDELAAQLCPGMEDPSPKDAFWALYKQNADTNSYFRSALATEYAERTAEIAVERARINQFVNLAEGSTTGDAELTDIRVGFDGLTYSTAGEAVRRQVDRVWEEFDDICKGETGEIYATAGDAVRDAMYQAKEAMLTAEESVRFTGQALTDEQKAQARKNIGAASVSEVGSVKETFNALPYLDSFSDEGFCCTPWNPETESAGTIEHEGFRNYYFQVCEGYNDHLFGKTLRIKTYAYGDMAYGEQDMGLRAINPDADIVNDPQSGVCEVTLTIPPFARPSILPEEDEWYTDHYFAIPFCENPYTELEMYVEHDTVWDSIRKLESKTILDCGYVNGWNYEVRNDGYAECSKGFVSEDLTKYGGNLRSLALNLPVPVWVDPSLTISVLGATVNHYEYYERSGWIDFIWDGERPIEGSITIRGRWKDYTIYLYIGDDAYTARPNMTWKDWCESYYNTAGFKCDTTSDKILSADNRVVLNSMFEDLPPVKASDIIRAEDCFQLEDN